VVTGEEGERKTICNSKVDAKTRGYAVEEDVAETNIVTRVTVYGQKEIKGNETSRYNIAWKLGSKCGG